MMGMVYQTCSSSASQRTAGFKQERQAKYKQTIRQIKFSSYLTKFSCRFEIFLQALEGNMVMLE